MRRLTISILFLLGFVSNCRYIQPQETVQTFSKQKIIKNHSTRFLIGVNNNDTIRLEALNHHFRRDDGIKMSDSICDNTNFYIGNNLVFNEKSESLVLKLDVIKVVHVNSVFYVIIARRDPLFGNDWKIYKFQNNGYVESYAALSDIFEDLDSDGIIEIGGIGSIEGYCQTCDSQYYRPYYIYELSDQFQLDSVMSKKKTLDIYENFWGYEYKYVPVKIIAK